MSKSERHFSRYDLVFGLLGSISIHGLIAILIARDRLLPTYQIKQYEPIDLIVVEQPESPSKPVTALAKPASKSKPNSTNATPQPIATESQPAPSAIQQSPSAPKAIAPPIEPKTTPPPPKKEAPPEPTTTSNNTPVATPPTPQPNTDIQEQQPFKEQTVEQSEIKPLTKPKPDHPIPTEQSVKPPPSFNKPLTPKPIESPTKEPIKPVPNSNSEANSLADLPPAEPIAPAVPGDFADVEPNEPSNDAESETKSPNELPPAEPIAPADLGDLADAEPIMEEPIAKAGSNETEALSISCEKNCQPEYPSALNGIEGSAGIQSTIDRDGRVIDAAIATSNGNPKIEQEALQAAKKMEFSAIDRDTATVRINISFTEE